MLDENFTNNQDENQEVKDNTTVQYETEKISEADEDIKNLTMDDKGRIRPEKGGAAAIAGSSRTFIILGWISAALTALISPYFAIPGVVFGVFVNRQSRGKGNAIIITNIVLAMIYFIFRAVLLALGGRMTPGY